ncbi:protein tipE-like isoform X1 [Uranotaenia lowii]|uniref:protein tipE-like isoform X1 n=1 Tax=Uranotaenia lowii TaxID=190385 RepID=UPI0024794307|nr:protein tipE-like isoform X1 [Uranotaenia lowii]
MDEEIVPRTLREKALFYTTAFFILLGTFSLFAFLFLVPFVIEPAFTTIFMQFDESPALCVTVDLEHLYGAKNCSWASCREGCTKDIYECQQIRVSYKTSAQLAEAEAAEAGTSDGTLMTTTMTTSTAAASKAATATATKTTGDSSVSNDSSKSSIKNNLNRVSESSEPIKPIATADRESSSSLHGSSRYETALNRFERAVRADYDYNDMLVDEGINGFGDHRNGIISSIIGEDNNLMEYPDDMTELTGNDSEWFFTGARLFPNVKGCGYPPMLNCTIWTKKYWKIGTNFTCYYSRVDPGLVISDLDMWQNTLNLVYAMAIPIPSFIISVIYLAFAYFVIYNEDEEAALLDKNDEEDGVEDELNETDEGNDNKINESEAEITANHINEHNADEGNTVNTTTTTPIQQLPNGTANSINNINNTNTNTTATTNTDGSSKPMTPNSTSDLNSFGHQLKVKMADEMSRESIDGGLLSNSASLQGNLSKTMTTSISTPPGPIAAV